MIIRKGESAMMRGVFMEKTIRTNDQTEWLRHAMLNLDGEIGQKVFDQIRSTHTDPRISKQASEKVKKQIMAAKRDEYDS